SSPNKLNFFGNFPPHKIINILKIFQLRKVSQNSHKILRKFWGKGNLEKILRKFLFFIFFKFFLRFSQDFPKTFTRFCDYFVTLFSAGKSLEYQLFYVVENYQKSLNYTELFRSGKSWEN